MTMTIQRDDNGQFPSHAWPGGYPILYITEDSACLCPACANRENGSEASDEDGTPADWHLVGADIHWEGAPETCAHCNATIESAYGDPGAEQEGE